MKSLKNVKLQETIFFKAKHREVGERGGVLVFKFWLIVIVVIIVIVMVVVVIVVIRKSLVNKDT